MKQIWNKFCKDVQEKKKKDALEMDFEISVVRMFLFAHFFQKKFGHLRIIA